MTDWQPAGPHRYRTEGDSIRWESRGAVAPAQAHTFAQLVLGVTAAHGRAYCVVDGREMLPLPAESRRVYLDYLKRHHPRFVLAIFGAPFQIRVAGLLVVNAARILSLPELNVRYTVTEEEAVRYVEEQRRRSG